MNLSPEPKQENWDTLAKQLRKDKKMTLNYLVTCKCKNGNVIPAFTDSFSSALSIAEMFESGEYTEEIKILKISTGATFEFTV